MKPVEKRVRLLEEFVAAWDEFLVVSRLYNTTRTPADLARFSRSKERLQKLREKIGSVEHLKEQVRLVEDGFLVDA